MDFKDIIHAISLAVRAGPAVNELIEAGKPVEQAAQEAAPELNAAIKKLADAVFPAAPKPREGSPAPMTTPHLIVQKAIFTPDNLEDHEQEVIDRASSPLSGGAG